jgi:hypothetical protein
MPYCRQTEVIVFPVSASRKMRMICSSVYRFFMKGSSWLFIVAEPLIQTGSDFGGQGTSVAAKTAVRNDLHHAG